MVFRRNFRKGRSRSRKRFTKRGRRGKFRAKKMGRMIRRVARRAGELKMKPFSDIDTMEEGQYYTYSAEDVMRNILKGTDNDRRVGRKIWVKRIVCKLFIHWD